jgi:hypothetical protein
MPPEMWEVLGIEQTRDRDVIRRAYAAALKATNPEDKPEEFKLLRFAYERALAFAAAKTPVSIAPIPAPAPSPATNVVEPEIAGPPDPVQLLANACDALEHMVRLGTASPAELAAALAEIFALPAFQLVGTQARTEQWLLHLLIRNVPRSDALLATAIAQFGWRANVIGRRDAAMVWQVLKRSDDLKLRAEMMVPGTAHYAAYQVLTAPPQPHGLWRRLRYPVQADYVKRLLALIDRQHQSLLKDLNKDSLAYWRQYGAVPRLPDLILWAILVCPLSILLLLLPGTDPTWKDYCGTWVGIIACITVGSLIWHYVVVWPRYWWRVRLAGRAPAWTRIGWAPAVVGLVLVAAVLPPALPVLRGLLVVSIAVALWAVITGEPDRRSWTTGLRWQARILFTEAWLMGWWGLMIQYLPAARYAAMSAPLAAGVVASTFAIQPLYARWYQLKPPAQRVGMGAVAALAMLAGALLILAAAKPVWLPCAMAWTAVAVLANRVVSSTLTARVLKIRYYVMLGAVFLGSAAMAPMGLPWSVTGTGCLLVGVVFTVLAVWVRI